MIDPGDVQDRDGGILLVSTLFAMYPFLEKLFADRGYQGAKFRGGVANILPGLEIEIVRGPAHGKSFMVLPRRWIVERTIAWLNRCRRRPRNGTT